MPDRHYLILDQGGHASRALLYDARGRLVRQATREVATRRPAPGCVEQDADALAGTLDACIKAVLDGDAEVMAGLACQRSSIAFWHRETGAALAPVLSWQDTRADALFGGAGLDPVMVRAATGLVPSAHYGATKLAWGLRRLDSVRAAHADGALCAGPLASFLLFRLLDGRPYLAPRTLAQRTLLFDLAADRWSPSLLAAFGLPDDLLPAVMPDCAPLGSLRGRAIPVGVCVGDQNAVPYAAGEPDPGTLYANAGTGVFLLRPLADDDGVPDGLLRTLLPDGRCAAEGTVNGAGAALDWLADTSGVATPWADLDALAAVPADAPLFVNGIGDLGSPFWCTGVTSRFVPDTGSPLVRAYAVTESIAFLARANADRMRAAGLPVERVRLGGGLAASGLLCRLLAAALDAPVARAADLEATARGVLAMLGGPIDDGPPTRFEPDPRWVDALEPRYARWRLCMNEAGAGGTDVQVGAGL